MNSTTALVRCQCSTTFETSSDKLLQACFGQSNTTISYGSSGQMVIPTCHHLQRIARLSETQIGSICFLMTSSQCQTHGSTLSSLHGILHFIAYLCP